MGALATAAMTWLFPWAGDVDRAWVRNVAILAVEVAAIGLAAAVFSARRLPSTTDIRRRVDPAEPLHLLQVVVFSSLLIGAVLQLPVLLAWFAEDRALLQELSGPGTDPLGLYLVP